MIGTWFLLTYSLQNQQSHSIHLPQPNLQNKNDFRSSIINQNNVNDHRTAFLSKLRLHSISNFFLLFDPIHPIIDFSIPPSRAYKKISACELLGSCKARVNIPNNLDNQIVIIASGVYEESGVDRKGDQEHNSFIPLAVAFWHDNQGGKEWLSVKPTFTSGEAHAYMVHHLLTRHLVVAIPDFFHDFISCTTGKIYHNYITRQSQL